MVICHIITAFGFGGAEKLLADLVNIQSLKHKVHIVYLKGDPLMQALLINTVRLHKVDLKRGVIRNLRKLIKSIRPDVVHTHVGHADFIGLWACRDMKVKRFCTMHNIRYKWNYLDYVIFATYALLFKTAARNCTVIAISKVVANHLEKIVGVRKKNIRLIYNAIPDKTLKQSKEELQSELNIPTNSFCVLFVGRLEIAKSVDTLLYAVHVLKGRIPRLHIVIVGDGSMKDNLKRLSMELYISELVHFAGSTTQAEKYFSASDVFVLPSIFEGFGIVIIEAFRSSLPVVASDIEGPKELITHNVNGLLFKPQNHIMLADHILKLYESPALRQQLGLSGYMSYADKYDINSYANKIEELYLQ